MKWGKRCYSKGVIKFRRRVTIQLNKMNLTDAEKKAELKKATAAQLTGQKYYFPG